MTTAVAVGAAVLAACASPVGQSSMGFESSPAPTLESRAVHAAHVDRTGERVEAKLVSEVVPPPNHSTGDNSALSDDGALLTSAAVAPAIGPAVATAVTGPATAVATSDQPPTGRAEVNGIIDDAGATLVAHAVADRLVAYAEPGSNQPVARLDNPTSHGGPLVLQAMTPPGSAQIDFGWIEVLLPVRPNGTTGWIQTDEVDLSVNPYRIEVDVDDFTLTVLRNNAPYLTTPVGIGRGQTPTPVGSFYLAELLRPSDPDGIYGPYAYGLSGYSEVLDSFAGGGGVIGIHGTNEPWAIGTNVSHGCIRVDNSVIEALATFLPLGTPVDIGA